jgi:hypothetical protein
MRFFTAGKTTPAQPVLSAFAQQVLAGQRARVPDYQRPTRRAVVVGPVKPAQPAPFTTTCSLCGSPSAGQVCGGCAAHFAAGGTL